MVNGASTSRRDRTAIATSIALHLCVLAAVATVPRPSFPLDEPDERVLLTTIVRITRSVQPALPRRGPARAHAASAGVRPAPAVHVAVSTAHSARTLVVAAERRYSRPAPERATSVRKNDEPLPHAAAAARTATIARADPVPVAAAATPPPSAVPTAAVQRDDGIGNFGETYPAAVDPAARGALFAGLGGTFDVRITVDETGRATAIEFLRAPSDPTLRDELRSRLQAARFIPAACNGLRCAGTVVLRNG